MKAHTRRRSRAAELLATLLDTHVSADSLARALDTDVSALHAWGVGERGIPLHAQWGIAVVATTVPACRRKALRLLGSLQAAARYHGRETVTHDEPRLPRQRWAPAPSARSGTD